MSAREYAKTKYNCLDSQPCTRKRIRRISIVVHNYQCEILPVTYAMDLLSSMIVKLCFMLSYLPCANATIFHMAHIHSRTCTPLGTAGFQCLCFSCEEILNQRLAKNCFVEIFHGLCMASLFHTSLALVHQMCFFLS